MPPSQALCPFLVFDTIPAMNTKPLFLAYTFVLVSVFAGTPVAVQAQHMNEKDSPCADVVATSDQVSCLSKAKDAADAKLNDLYKKLRQRLEGGDARPPC